MNLAREKERLKSIKGEREKDVEMKTEDKEKLIESAEKYGKSDYGKYLKRIAEG